MNKYLMKIVLCGVLIAFSTAFAQTEVEGEVSGDWNAEGSPYLVIGDITIPEEDTLTILQGVEISVLSELSIIVNGVLITAGTEEERVVIHGDEDNEAPWTGIFFDKPDDTSTMAYTDITDSEICIILDATHNLELDNCSFNGVNNAVFAERDLGDYRVIAATNCEFTTAGDTRTFDVYAGELIANDCTFLSGRSAIIMGGVLRLQNCTAVGAVVCRFGTLEIEDCDLSRPERQDVDDVTQVTGFMPTRGFIRNSSLGGPLTIFSHDAQSFRLTDSVIEGDVRFDDCTVTIRNNTIGVDSLVVVRISDGSVAMDSNSVNGEIDLDDTRFTISDNSFHVVRIDVGEGNNRLINNTIIEELEIRGGEQLTIENNKISGEIDIRNANSSLFKYNTILATIKIRTSIVNFTQNTIVTPEPVNRGNQEMIELYARGSNITINSNIFLGIYANSLFNHQEEAEEIQVNYNCFWMMDYYNLYLNTNDFLADRINETNIIADPLLLGIDPLNVGIQPISPCRNSGDPELDDDPDETRADIGSVFFDHRIDHVPGIHSPEFVFAQRGENFRYAAKGSDEEEVNFEFNGLPDWLQPVEERDIIEDSLVLVGQVPDDEVDFSFQIIVTDNNDQVDSLSVSVRCIDQKPIGGFVSGRITAEGSPYFIARTLIIDHEDTLTIEPGCEFTIRALDFPQNKRPSIIVLGRLIMSGTEEDTIKFSPELLDEGDTRWDGIRFYNENVSYNYEYLKFTNHTALLFYRADRVSISHSLFINVNESNTSRVITVKNAQRVSLHDNVFLRTSTKIENSIQVSAQDNLFKDENSFLYVSFCENVISTRNSFIGDIYPFGFWSLNVDTLILSRCVFDSTRRAFSISGGNLASVINCTVFDSQIHLNTGENGNITIINSTFYGNMLNAITDQSYVEGTVNITYSNFFGYDRIFWDAGELGEACIFEDPLFVDPDNGIFWLSDDSPLIDAGHPELYLDPDSSRADLGSYFWTPDGSTGILKPDIEPDKFELNIYPNPFNSWLTINYNLKIKENIVVDIYDLNGRIVLSRELLHSSPGKKTFAFNSGSFPSGQYLLSLKSPSFHRIHNIVHVK